VDRRARRPYYKMTRGNMFDDEIEDTRFGEDRNGGSAMKNGKAEVRSGRTWGCRISRSWPPARAGDRSAFAQLWRRIMPDPGSGVASSSPSSVDADDLVSGICALAYHQRVLAGGGPMVLSARTSTTFVTSRADGVGGSHDVNVDDMGVF
jgi:hypothetical protein